MDKIRLNIKDMWNLKLTDNNWENDIPMYSAYSSIPKGAITYSNALKIYKKMLREKNDEYKIHKHVYFTLEDINKNKSHNIWYHYKFISKVTNHFDGIFAPYYACEYSNRTIRHNYNIYKMQTIGKFFSDIGQNVIYTFSSLHIKENNISFSGISTNSIVYIDIHNYKNYPQTIQEFEKCLKEFIEIKKPKIFVLIGDKNNPKFNIIKSTGIDYLLFEDENIYSFEKTTWQLLEDNDKIFNEDGYLVCIPTKQSIPNKIISWTEARSIYKKTIQVDKNFKIDAYVHFYIDDQCFDGPLKGIWMNPNEAYQILTHFAGIITVDYSTYQDFPIPIKQFAIYRMALSGILANKYHIEVINNLRLDIFNSYSANYLPKGGIIAIGTVASNMKSSFYKEVFTKQLDEYFSTNKFYAVIVFGSSKYEPFNKLRLNGTIIKSFKSHKNRTFGGGEDYV